MHSNFPFCVCELLMRLRPKKRDKKRQKGKRRRERNMYGVPERRYKAVIMPQNEKWKKVVGGRK